MKFLPVQFLQWDSDFFQFKVGKITSPELSEPEFMETVQYLKKDGYALVYWPANESIPKTIGPVIEAHDGFLADMKTTYVLNDMSNTPAVPNPGIDVISYNDSMPVSDLVTLAIRSGESSRFALDPRIPRERYEELYKLWILKSVSGELAKDVLIIRDEQTIGGMVTVGEKNGRGDIGLVAVDERYRGKSFGKSLVQAAINWSKNAGYSSTQVVTQGTNIAACRLYEACGYSVEKVEAFYHLWL